MTKKNVRRFKLNRKNFVAIPFTGQNVLGTLGSETVLAINLFDAVFGEDIFVISVDILSTIRGLTAGEAPIEIGFAHGDLSVGEIAEALDAELTDPDDIIAKERARRPVRRIGIFGGSGTEQVLNDGNPKRVTVKFSVGDGFFLNHWARNHSGSVLTTGAVVEFQGTLYGRWQR